MSLYEVQWRAEGSAYVEAETSGEATLQALNDLLVLEEVGDFQFTVDRTEQVSTTVVEG